MSERRQGEHEAGCPLYIHAGPTTDDDDVCLCTPAQGKHEAGCKSHEDYPACNVAMPCNCGAAKRATPAQSEGSAPAYRTGWKRGYEAGRKQGWKDRGRRVATQTRAKAKYFDLRGEGWTGKPVALSRMTSSEAAQWASMRFAVSVLEPIWLLFVVMAAENLAAEIEKEDS